MARRFGVFGSHVPDTLSLSLSNYLPSKVLRSYDYLFRETDRSPEIYLDPQCKDIVGGEVTVVVKLPAEGGTESSVGHSSELFWASQRQLQIIAFPYKNGKHYTSKPTDFIGIIEQLEMLHRCGYLHGDIRGFNVLFGDEGGLIDFDFGGIPGKAYPEGYRQILTDGWRIGTSYADDTDNELQFYHDWFALGRLMFTVHEWNEPMNSESDADELRHFDAKSKWNHLDSNPTPADIEMLKDDLNYFDQHWTVCPERSFAQKLSLFQEQTPVNTFGGAPGSPKAKSNE